MGIALLSLSAFLAFQMARSSNGVSLSQMFSVLQIPALCFAVWIGWVITLWRQFKSARATHAFWKKIKDQPASAPAT